MKANELFKRIESKSAPIIIDVRTGAEFKRGHIPGAINAPPQKILLKTASLPENKDTELVIYCGHGPRAWLARKLLTANDYTNTDLLEGHWTGWKKDGLPLEK
jgi:rhodanese-related sulfurtransferase